MSKPMSDEALKAAILERRRAGAAMKDLIGTGKLTNTWRFEKMKREDVSFRAALVQVEVELGRSGRVIAFDAAMEDRIIALVREGWNQKQRRTIVGVPSWRTIDKHRKANPAFDQRIQEARASIKPPAKRRLASKLCLSDDEKERILDRLRQGANFTDLGDDLPPYRQILVHRRADPLFDRQVSDLVSAARDNEHQRLDRSDELKAAIVAALEAGRPLKDLGPGLPSYTFVHLWRRDDPIFAQTLRECADARSRANADAKIASHDTAAPFASRKAQVAQKRMLAGKQAFLESLDDGVRFVDVYAKVASRGAVKAWRAKDLQFDAIVVARTAGRRTATGSVTRYSWTDEQRRGVIAAIEQGASLGDLGGALPTQWMVENRRALDPEFDRAVVEAFGARARWKASLRKPKLVRRASMPLTFQLTQTNDLYAAANRAVSRSFPPHVRDDIISEIVLSVLVGETQPDEIAAAAKAFVNAYLRDQNGYALASIDAVVGTSGSGSFHDLIAVV